MIKWKYKYMPIKQLKLINWEMGLFITQEMLCCVI